MNVPTESSGGRAPQPPTPPELPARSSLPDLDRADLLALYRQMVLIRRVEELAAKAYTQRKIFGFCHLYIGQESVAVGAASLDMSMVRKRGQKPNFR